MILIVASDKDEASYNIARKIVELYEFDPSESFQEKPMYRKMVGDADVRLIFINEELIYIQFIPVSFSPDIVIFVSRHSSISEIPTLSVHTPGNLTNEANFGGVPKKVSISPASVMKDTLKHMAEMREETKLDYKVSYECTHHGPSLDVPTMFAELGSSPKQWRDLKAAEVVARAVINAIYDRSTYPAALGVGGPHYNEKFTKIALETSLAFGHIIPKYAIPSVDASMIKQCTERTKERVELAIFDWKGVQGAERNRLISAVSSLGLTIKRA